MLHATCYMLYATILPLHHSHRTQDRLDRSGLAHHQALRASREYTAFIPSILPPTSNVTVVIGQPNFLICVKPEKHKMADKAEVMKWFAGREVEVLDDQKGIYRRLRLKHCRTTSPGDETTLQVSPL